MYCRNCGEELKEGQAMCVKCGFMVGNGESFCSFCGKPMNAGQDICLNCGMAEKKNEKGGANNLNGQDKMTMALVCFFLGGLGIHNFMMGEQKKGIMKIVFSLLCGIGAILALIDFFKILTDKYQYNPDAAF